jgi:hypothetical protein
MPLKRKGARHADDEKEEQDIGMIYPAHSWYLDEDSFIFNKVLPKCRFIC